MVFVVFLFSGSCLLFSTRALLVTFPTTVHVSSFSPQSSPSISRLIDESYSDRCEVLSHWFLFAPFHVTVGHLFLSFAKNDMKLLCPFISQIPPCPHGVIWVPYIFRHESLIRQMVCKDFLPFHWCFFHLVDCFLCCAIAFQFDGVPLVYFGFCYIDFWCPSLKIPCQDQGQGAFSPTFSSRRFMVSSLILNSWVYFKLIFLLL